LTAGASTTDANFQPSHASLGVGPAALLASARASATLGKSVPENTCVQARSDTKWHRCQDAEWLAASGPDDPKCTGQKFPLP